jgi:hypothetical protein
METVQVFIKTEEEEKEDVLVHQTQFLLEETPCVESTESERLIKTEVDSWQHLETDLAEGDDPLGVDRARDNYTKEKSHR